MENYHFTEVTLGFGPRISTRLLHYLRLHNQMRSHERSVKGAVFFEMLNLCRRKTKKKWKQNFQIGSVAHIPWQYIFFNGKMKWKIKKRFPSTVNIYEKFTHSSLDEYLHGIIVRDSQTQNTLKNNNLFTAKSQDARIDNAQNSEWSRTAESEPK